MKRNFVRLSFNIVTLHPGLSPAQKLYSHPVQNVLPAHWRSFAPEWQRSIEEAMLQAAATKETTERYYDTTTHSLPLIHVESNVASSTGPYCQYHVITSKGRIVYKPSLSMPQDPHINPRRNIKYPADHKSAINSRVTTSKDVKSHKETNTVTSGRPNMELRIF